MVEQHWLDGQYDRLPALMADLPPSRSRYRHARQQPCFARRQSCDLDNPDRLRRRLKTRSSLVSSPASRGRAATRPASIFSSQEVVAKRLGLLHELVPKAVRVAVLVNPANAPTAETTLREVPEAARAFGLQIQIFNASTIREIEAAFATLVREHPEALFVAADDSSSAAASNLHLATAMGYPPLIRTRGRRSGRADELWDRSHGHVSSGRRLHRSESSRARTPPSCRSCNRPNSSSSSISKRRGHLASRCPIRSNCNCRRGDRIKRCALASPPPTARVLARCRTGPRLRATQNTGTALVRHGRAP